MNLKPLCQSVRPKQNAVGLSVFSKLIQLNLNVPIYEMYFNAASKKICILIQAYTVGVDATEHHDHASTNILLLTCLLSGVCLDDTAPQ